MDAKERIEKVTRAMLCMERYPWEQGEASQALLELGDYENAYLMAHDAVLRQSPDGRLGTTFYRDHVAMFGDTSTVTDAVNNGQAVLYFAEKNHDASFLEAARKQIAFLMETAPRAKNGAISHVLDLSLIHISAGRAQDQLLKMYKMRRLCESLPLAGDSDGRAENDLRGGRGHCRAR